MESESHGRRTWTWRERGRGVRQWSRSRMDHETHGKMPGERESKDAIINMAITRDDVQQMQLQSMNVKSTAAGNLDNLDTTRWSSTAVGEASDLLFEGGSLLKAP